MRPDRAGPNGSWRSSSRTGTPAPPSITATYATAFDAADVVVVTEVYAAGEDPIAGIDGRLVYDAIARADDAPEVWWAPTRHDQVSLLTELLVDGDLCVTMGAGDLTTLADDVIAALRRRGG